MPGTCRPKSRPLPAQATPENELARPYGYPAHPRILLRVTAVATYLRVEGFWKHLGISGCKVYLRKT
eukprot:363227-Chlamydomonas_euryale.AAC.7